METSIHLLILIKERRIVWFIQNIQLWQSIADRAEEVKNRKYSGDDTDLLGKLEKKNRF